MVVGGLDEAIEGVGGGHVPEVGEARGVNIPALGKHCYLAELAAGGEVVGPEGAVPVAGDYPAAIEVAHRFVEVVGGLHVRKIHGAGGCCRRGGQTWAAVTAVTLHERLKWAITCEVVAHGPDVTARCGRNPLKPASGRARV